MTTNPAPLPELVRDSKLEATTFQDDLTIHSQPLGRRRRTEKWRRREVLGHGGYGIVWLEHKIDEDGDAESVCRAVKVVRNRGRGSIHYVRELEALAKFSQDKFSDFFVKFLGWYENPASDYLHIAMEYCAHGDLKNYLVQNGGKLPENEVKDIASQVLAGVVMMHRAGFANRDIKPANILIKSMPPGDWWVKICDFGLSKRAEDGFAFATTTVRGTPEFMPPEILGFSTSPGRIDVFKVDMWCLGETVFQALTGQPVFGIPAAVGRYLEGSLNFPTETLRHVNATDEVTSFITSLMRALPFQRITSEAAIKHPWMVDMTPREALCASETSNMATQSTEIPFQDDLPQTRVPGDQLTQASGQWTTTMTLPNQPSQPSKRYSHQPEIMSPSPNRIGDQGGEDSRESLYSEFSNATMALDHTPQGGSSHQPSFNAGHLTGLALPSVQTSMASRAVASQPAGDQQLVRCPYQGCDYRPNGISRRNHSSYLRRHINNKHLVSYRVRCPDCDVRLRRSDNLRVHQETACSRRYKFSLVKRGKLMKGIEGAEQSEGLASV